MMMMNRKLEDYNRKRDFRKSEEPAGKEEASGKKLHFVVQKHDASRLHFDFRIEWDGVLLSWAVPKGPSTSTRDKRLAVHVEDHPLAYRNFEGTIPKDEYGGGTVMLFDEGYWEPQEDMEKGYKNGSVKMIIHGERMKGKWALVRMKQGKDSDNKNWLLIKEKDEYNEPDNTLDKFDTSIRTGRTMSEIRDGKAEKKKEAAQIREDHTGKDTKAMKNTEDENRNKNDEIGLPFKEADAMLAKLEDKLPSGKNWIYELKYDGYRILAFLENGTVRLMTRNQKDYTDKFPGIKEALREFSFDTAMVLDGEVVVLDEAGKSDFQRLQNAMKKENGSKLFFVVFDLLALGDADLRSTKLQERKEKLKDIVGTRQQRILYSDHSEGNGKDFLLAACSMGMEGIICKKKNSLYSGTRNGEWLKVKCGMRQEFVVGGYTLTDKKSSGVSALLLGYYEEGRLIYAGRAGTGFTRDTMADLESAFKPLIRKTSPFEDPPKERRDEEIFWLTPNLVTEIKFHEWTDDGYIRQGSFKGLREDKAPEDVVREKPESISDEKDAEKKLLEIIPDRENEEGELDVKKENHEAVSSESGEDMEKKKKEKLKSRKNLSVDGLKFTSPDKDMYDGIGVTKEDVARYYAEVSERMLPHVENRILSILRCPEGISGSCFFQKHVEKEGIGMEKVAVTEKSGDEEDYISLTGPEGLISSVQMGTLEFHVWGSRADDLEKPDMLVFDLDPAEGMDIKKVRDGVRDMKMILDELSLRSFLKTSGGKGYHVVVPLRPQVEWEEARDFARLCAQAMEEKWPDRYTSNMRKEKRKGKIFIDWIRNGRSATSVAPYSLRARKNAPVSMPIDWAELDEVLPSGITIKDALEMLDKEDPWADFFTTEQSLKGKK